MDRDQVVFAGLGLALILGLSAAASQCAPGPDRAEASLRALGFSDVKIVNSHRMTASFYGCGEDDAVAHEASATNAAGQRVAVTVCCGLVFKGCTVRTP